MVTSKPFIVRSEASVAPDGPLPMTPTVLIDVLIIENWFYGLITNAELFARFVDASQYKILKSGG
jgi:hypothetical protein